MQQRDSIVVVAKRSRSHAGKSELKALGDAIRRLRARSGLSQEVLAHDAEIDRSYLGGIERGEHNVAVVNLVKISRRLDISVAELFLEARL